jgi:hypothetical protein
MSESAKNFLESLRSAADVSGLVGRPEDLYFEAKTCAEPFSETDQGHLAEALSGFANADGGVLIYGLVAAGGDRTKPDVVTKVERIRNVDLLNSRILGLIGQLVEPPAPNVQVVPVKFDRLPDEGFVLVHVPASDLGPHRSRKDREYCRRHGHGFFPMEHFEIAEMFGRRRHPSLELVWKPSRFSPIYKGTSKRLRIPVTIGLKNSGRGIAKYPAIWISGVYPHEAGVDGNGQLGLPARPTSAGCLFAGGADDVVYPGASIDVATVAHEFPTPPSLDARWNDLTLDYEIFAEQMETVKNSLKVPGEELKTGFDSQRIVTWPSH